MTEARQSICVVGLGYIGLPTAAVFASHGRNVLGVDVSSQVVETINRGEIHIVEPDLEAITHHAVKQGYLKAATKPAPADVFLIAVPTPFHDGRADLSYVRSAAESIAPVLESGDLVILESTSPPGTTERLVEQFATLRPDLRFPSADADSDCDVSVAYCPERVLPGRILTELVENDRVIGGITRRCAERAVAVYRTFCQGQLLVTNARTAEMCKLTENAFRDVNIAFANELSIICDRLNVNVWELIKLANCHPRVNILQPGPGVGGHCIAVDPWFIVEAAPGQAELIRTARKVNDSKPDFVTEKIRDAVRRTKNGDGKTNVLVLGLTFKPNVDDLRESPALHIAEMLADWDDVNLLVSEPHLKELPDSLAGRDGVRLETNINAAIEAASVVVMLVDHKQYGAIKRSQLDGKVVVDTRGMWS